MEAGSPAALASPSVLAFVSTIHLCLLLLRKHRSVHSLLAAIWLLPSLAFGVGAWLLSTPGWLVGGVGAHLAWYLACEAVLRKRAPATGEPTRVAAAGSGPAIASAAPPVEIAPVHQRGFIPVPILAVLPETEDITTFRLARPDGFAFRAGQFLTVRIEVEGKPLVRCYSISSAPQTSGYMEISVKRVGRVSGTLHATLRPGSELHVKPPAGRFVYPEGDDRPIVLLAGGVGITPLASMLRHGIAAQPSRPITLLFSVHSERDVVFRQELEWAAGRFPNATVLVTVSDGHRAAGQLAGRINEAMLRQVVADIQNSVYMICGPNPMMEAMRRMLSGFGVPAAQVQYEEFEIAVAAARELNVEARPAAAPSTAVTVSSPGAGAPARDGFHLKLERNGATVRVGAGQTLLEAAEGAGAEIPSSCRAGVCLTCRTRLLSGNVDCDSESLDESDRAAGYVLPCVAWAKCDCVLDA